MPARQDTPPVRTDAMQNVLNHEGSGLSRCDEFLEAVLRVASALEVIAASVQSGSKPRRQKRLTRGEKVDIAMAALVQFGRAVPTWDDLSEATGIPVSTLNGLTEVRDARQKLIDEVRRERSSHSTPFDAWEDKDRE